MNDLLKYLKAVVIGFAVLAGGRALYANRDRLTRNWRNLGGLGGVKDLRSNLSVGKALGTVNQIRDLANQFSHLK